VRAIIIFLLALIVVLPLYELADYGEHWTHDGDVAVPVLLLLCLAGFAYICRVIVAVVHLTAESAVFPLLLPVIEIRTDSLFVTSNSMSVRMLCDLRI
jgi:hypothetical protein